MASDASANLGRIRSHLERHLGGIRVLSQLPEAAGEEVPFAVATFADRPSPGAVTYSTLGLGDHLVADLDGSRLAYELLVACQAGFGGDDLILFLMTIGREVLRRGEPLLEGTVLDLGRPLVRGASVEAVLVFEPVYFPESLALCEATNPRTALVWLVPLVRREVDFVAEHGFEALTDRFLAVDPDLLDWRRESAVAQGSPTVGP